MINLGISGKKIGLFCASALIAGAAVGGSAAIGITLEAAIEARSAESRARDSARNPRQTVEFMRIEPGMTVAEGLPASGWYTKILAPYLGSEGTLYGVNYADRMWSMFSWSTPELVARSVAGTAQFPDLVKSITDNGIQARGFTFESVPADVVGTVDRVVLIRALHNLSRFNSEAGTLDEAMSSIHSMLKENGLVGVVQHRVPDTASEEGAQGDRGYMRQSDVIRLFSNAGFELVDTSEVNANPNDTPTESETSWRLPPVYRGMEEGSLERAAVDAIGESDRMTLLFKKVSK